MRLDMVISTVAQWSVRWRTSTFALPEVYAPARVTIPRFRVVGHEKARLGRHHAVALNSPAADARQTPAAGQFGRGSDGWGVSPATPRLLRCRSHVRDSATARAGPALGRALPPPCGMSLPSLQTGI